MTGNDTKCSQCGDAVEEELGFCLRCGRQSDAGSSSAGDDLYLKLITANVMRLRREWTLAEAKCSEVFRRDPENAAAHSVMGDIARDRRSLREAAEWYKMALDRNPGSAADRKKLEAVIDQMLFRPRAGIVAGALSAVRRCLATAAADLRWGRRPRPLAMIALGVVVAVVAIALATLVWGPRPATSPTAPSPEATSGAFVAPAEEQTAGPETREPAANPQFPPAHEWAPELQAREQELVDHVSEEAERRDPTCRVLGGEVDPRTGEVRVRISMPRRWSAASMREPILRSMLGVAAAAVSWDARVPQVQVRCAVRQPGQPDQVAAVAEGTREQVENLEVGTATGAEIRAGLASVWLSPELEQ